MTTLTVSGNLTNDPELRYTPSGMAVCSITVAENQRKFNKQTGQWEEDGTLFMRGTLWREAAENASSSLRKGMRVIAVGQLKQSTYTTRDGQERTQIEMTVEELGPSTRYASMQVAQSAPRQNPQAQQGYAPAFSNPPAPQATFNAPTGGTTTDPWAQQPTLDDEPPF